MDLDIAAGAADRTLKVAVPPGVQPGGSFHMRLPPSLFKLERAKLATARETPDAPSSAPDFLPAELRNAAERNAAAAPKPHAPGRGDYTSRGFYVSSQNPHATPRGGGGGGDSDSGGGGGGGGGGTKSITPEGHVAVTSSEGHVRIFSSAGQPLLELPLEVYSGAAERTIAALREEMQRVGLDPDAAYGWLAPRTCESSLAGCARGGGTPLALSRRRREATVASATARVGGDTVGLDGARGECLARAQGRRPVRRHGGHATRGAAGAGACGCERIGAVRCADHLPGALPRARSGLGLDAWARVQRPGHSRPTSCTGAREARGASASKLRQVRQASPPSLPEPTPHTGCTLLCCRLEEERSTVHTHGEQAYSRDRDAEPAYGSHRQATAAAESRLPPGLAQWVLRWVQTTTHADAPADTPPLEALHQLLRSGEVLLQLLGALETARQSGDKSPPQQQEPPSEALDETSVAAARDECVQGASSCRKLPAAMGGVAFQHADRIERFLRGAQRLGLPKVSLFEVPALLEAADMPAVVVCLSGLAKCAGTAPEN